MKKLFLLLILFGCKKETVKHEPVPDPVKKTINLNWSASVQSFTLYVNDVATSDEGLCS